MTDILLTDKQVLKLAGKNTLLLDYPELSKVDNLDQLFNGNDKVIILYINSVSDTNIVGHWTLLTKVIRNGKIIIEFNDSYSLKPDQIFDTNKQVRKYGQEHNYLTRLLYHYSLNPNVEIHYNEYPMQSKNPLISTCGRYVGLRARFYKIPLEQYQNLIKSYKQKGYDIDKLITDATNQLL